MNNLQDTKNSQPEQEPVAKVITDNSRELIVESLTSNFLRKGAKLYTTPPQRTWVGLTDREAEKIYKDSSTFGEMMRMVEDKLKEKNA